MNKKGKESFFWTSYSDLMTSLFFIMLVLFILMLVSLRNSVQRSAPKEMILKELLAKLQNENDSLKNWLVKLKEGERASKEILDKIKEMEEAVNTIDSRWFRYDEEHKKHILQIAVAFDKGSSDIGNIPETTLIDLYRAGLSINDFIKRAYDKYNVKYLLIIEGQASKDYYVRNYELSYERALALVKFWTSKGLVFDSNYCEVIISGSGQSGTLRSLPDDANNKANQRFLIHIVPKPGIINASRNEN